MGHGETLAPGSPLHWLSSSGLISPLFSGFPGINSHTDCLHLNLDLQALLLGEPKLREVNTYM